MKLTNRQQELVKRTFLDFNPTSWFLDHPLVIEKARGLYYWDIEGKRYFDAIGGIFVAILGHGHPRVIEAVKKQLEKLTFAPPLHGISDVTLDLIEKIGSITPGNLKYVKPFSGGSEAIESSLKFVRQYFKQTGYPHKYKFISRYFSYHGGTIAAASASGSGSRKTKFEPLMSGFLKVYPPNYMRDRFSSWEECNRFCARMFEDVIINEGPETVAAVLVEPVGNTGGVITPTEEYFRIIRETCDRHNVILIFDETITGYGRTGEMFGAQTFKTVPDIICGGKALASGVIPLGAMIAKQEMASAFEGSPEKNLEFAHGHTFAGNPLACAAGIAVIDEILEKGLVARARMLGDYLRKKLEGLKDLGVIREVRGKGVFLGMEFVRDTSTNKPFPELGKALKETALRNGLIMRIDPTWCAVCPALIAGESDMDELADLIRKSIKDALEIVGKH